MTVFLTTSVHLDLFLPKLLIVAQGLIQFMFSLLIKPPFMAFNLKNL